MRQRDRLTLTDIIERDPSVVLKAVPEENGADVRLPFSTAEVVKLLRLCDQDAAEDAQRWVPRVLAYSGLRLDEAAQLQRSDIVERDGVWCYSVNAEEGKKIKTATAKRLVPIHSSLLGELLAYREGRPEGNLWGLAKGRYNYSAYLGKWLGKRVRRITKDRRKVIQGLRHNVATQLKSYGIEEHLIEGLLGHTSTLDVYRALRQGDTAEEAQVRIPRWSAADSSACRAGVPRHAGSRVTGRWYSG